MQIIKLDLIQTLGVALGVLLAGYALQKRIAPLKRWFIPAPLIGGALYALLAFVLRALGAVDIQLDTTLQPYFFAGFFASIGLRASRKMLAEGLPKLALFGVVVFLLAALQKAIGLGVGALLGIERPAITAATAVLMGNVAGAGKIVPVLAEQGLANGAAISAGAAAFGLLFGALLGGPLLAILIRRNGIKFPENQAAPAPLTPPNLIAHTFLYALCIGLGKLLSVATGGTWMPMFAGALIVGAALRNIADARPLFKLELPYVNTLGNFSLSCTLTMAFMGLKIPALAALDLPLLALLLVQLALPVLVAMFVVYPLMGRSPLAAMIAAGLPGFSVGVPADTMSTLQCAQEVNGAMPMATFVVPVIGAWLVTLVNPWLTGLFM